MTLHVSMKFSVCVWAPWAAAVINL